MPVQLTALKPFKPNMPNLAQSFAAGEQKRQQADIVASNLRGAEIKQQQGLQALDIGHKAIQTGKIQRMATAFQGVKDQATLDGAIQTLRAMTPPSELPEFDQGTERLFPGGQYNQQSVERIKRIGGAVQEVQTEKPFTLSPGQTRFGPGGEQIATVPAAPEKKGKKDFQLFESELGELSFIEKGSEIPPGSKPFVPDKGTKGASVDQIFKIRKQVLANPIVKDFLLIDSQSKRLDTAVKDIQDQKKEGRTPNFIAVDQALITILNKMLDPTSVVRESEYARTPSDQAALSRVKGSFKKLVTGGAKLEDADRDAVLRMARNFAKIAKERLSPEVDSIKNIAKKHNIDPDDIISPVLVADDPESDLFFDQQGQGPAPSQILNFDEQGNLIQ
jgi:hypothetical protein